MATQSFFTPSERGNLCRARGMSVNEGCLRPNLRAHCLLQQFCDRGLRQQPITLRLHIDNLYQIDPSRQLTCDRAA